MYNNDGLKTVATAGVVGGMGAGMLPHTAGNPIATMLAYGAIAIGLIALASQVVVRILRRRSQAKV